MPIHVSSIVMMSRCGAPDTTQTMYFPAITKYLYNICTMFAQRLRRWANIGQMLHKLCLHVQAVT